MTEHNAANNRTCPKCQAHLRLCSTGGWLCCDGCGHVVLPDTPAHRALARGMNASVAYVLGVTEAEIDAIAPPSKTEHNEVKNQ